MESVRGAFWLVVLLALIPRGVHFALTAHEPLRADSLEYDDLAGKLARSEGYTSGADEPLLRSPKGQPTAFRTPGFPLYAGALYALVGHEPLAVRGSLVLLNSLAAGILFAVGGRYGRRVGWLTGLGWAAWPGSIYTYWSSDAFLSEALAVPLLILLVWFIGEPMKSHQLVLAGLALGWVQLTRSYLVLLLPIAVLLALAGTAGPRVPALRKLLLVGALGALPLVAWSLRNFLVFHRFIPLSTQAGCSMWVGNNLGARGSGDSLWYRSPGLAALIAREPRILTAAEPEKSALFLRGTWHEIRQGGFRWLSWLLLRKLLLFFWPFDATYGFLGWLLPSLVLFPFGLVVCLRRHRGMTSIFVMGCVLTVLLTTLTNYHDSRYRYIAEPFMVMLAALALDALLVARARGMAPPVTAG